MDAPSIERKTFEIECEGLPLRGDIVGSNPSLLCLHGAGASCRKRMLTLRNALADRGIGSAAFDFLGHGESGGEIIGSSLESRSRQARAVIHHVQLPSPFAVMGISMGGYTAVRLTEEFAIHKLLLVVPALYAATAYRQPFGRRFSNTIRSLRSWEESDAWDRLRAFQGQVLLMRAGQDRIIPRELLDRLTHMALNIETLSYPEASHFLFSDLQEKQPMDWQQLIEKCASLLAKG